VHSLPWIAVDTEFMRERTYYARLCLIQLATTEWIGCVDPLCIDDLDPLMDVIYASDCAKVLHAARQDLEVLYDLRGKPPTGVFDTQIAAALAGFDRHVGYADLVHSITGVRLEKRHTRADWSARPLTEGRIRYAEDDVRYLPELYRSLTSSLERLGRLQWALEDCARLCDAGLYRNDPAHAYQRIGQGVTLAPAAQNILRALAAWREQTAQRLDLPRTWVMRDAVLVELARRAPKRPQELATIKQLPERAANRWGQAILDAVATGLAASSRPRWDRPMRLDAEQTKLCRHMLGLVRARAEELGMQPGVIASRRHIEAAILGNPETPLLTGWRRSIVGDELLALAGPP